MGVGGRKICEHLRPFAFKNQTFVNPVHPHLTIQTQMTADTLRSRR